MSVVKRRGLRLLYLGAVLSAVAGLAIVRPAQSQEAEQSLPVPPDEIIFESTTGNVLFSHQAHAKVRCARCHHQIHARELDTPHEEYLRSALINCQDCHKADPGSDGQYFKCADCHHSEPENISDETLSAKVVIHQSCWKCHRTGTGVKASEKCLYCHRKEERSLPLSSGPGALLPDTGSGRDEPVVAPN